MTFDFDLTPEQLSRYEEWRRGLLARGPEPYVGAVGGAYTFMFTPTGIGTLLRVVRVDGEEIDLTDYDSM